jgi:predicted O-methyltransferase YrrM
VAQPDWNDVDRYLVDTVLGDDPATSAALANNAANGLPPIDVSPTEGKLLALLARAVGARRVLEIGTLGGFSTIWLARAVGAEGRVITLEFEPKHAEVARENLEKAGVGQRVEIRVGPALESLPRVEADGVGPFDLFFIDADKENNVDYVEWALRLARPGAVIVVDNVVRSGAIADPRVEDGVDTTAAMLRGVRDVLAFLGNDPRLDATALQTVGSKGWDGMALAVVN